MCLNERKRVRESERKGEIGWEGMEQTHTQCREWGYCGVEHRYDKILYNLLSCGFHANSELILLQTIIIYIIYFLY